MSPRRADPAVAQRLVEVTARLLTTEGPSAVSARRVASEAGASTMAVYTHFGGMDQLLGAVRREGFQRFAESLARGGTTADPVADVMTQAWGYRDFARSEPHLYGVMFGPSGIFPRDATEADREAAMATFLQLVDKVAACAPVGGWIVDDAFAAAEVVWASVHGHCTLELAGYHEESGRDPVAAYALLLLHLAIGFGQPEADARRALSRSERRARKAGQLG